ncbi:MAG: nucleotidyl transferase AbiEii/AbiGii toxin family protein [Candidatus Diapherotrites archaeon]|uniref:Nucleotidyl transferase AbiEii/AbiGii toxin family protein n=1 Tax=Candidatus Iainarchaeum sp. TaxID=3101447 RepID=A0A8T3YN09_9ARCH|nr:nucleotidyl transferase AbiEii/AbiGii toxin family protein [Candidatus Diapherotrites archaeon]
MNFAEREKFLFSTLKHISEKADFVVIGGYAINAYVLPRFSIDCDIVVQNSKNAKKIQKLLENGGFSERAGGKLPYGGEFAAMASNEPPATFDILSQAVEDRLSGTIFPAKMIFENSSKKAIFGKGSPIQIKCRVVDPELLFLMKACPARSTDIRDLFMLSAIKLDIGKIRKMAKRINAKIDAEKILSKIGSRVFLNALQGVHGKLPPEQYEKTLGKARKNIEKLSQL